MIFMLLALKIPIVYLCGVVWWAIKAVPEPPGDPAAVAGEEPDLGSPWLWWRRSRRLRPERGGPRGVPARRAVGAMRSAPARAEHARTERR